MPTLTKSGHRLTDRQIQCLKVLKRAPKTNRQAHEQLLKTYPGITKMNVRSRMRSLENHELVRARNKYDKTLKRDVILWELTEKGRDILSKNGRL